MISTSLHVQKYAQMFAQCRHSQSSLLRTELKAPHRHSLTPLHHGSTGISRVKVRKLAGWNKDNSPMQTNQNKGFIHYIPSAGRCLKPSPGKQGSVMSNGYLGRQTPSFQTSSPFLLLLPTSIAEHDIW